jgi:hypothetical protein
MSVIEGESHLLHKERQHSTSHNDSAGSNGRTVGNISLASHGSHYPLSKQFVKRQNTFIETGDEETSKSRTLRFTNFMTVLHKRKQFLFVPSAISHFLAVVNTMIILILRLCVSVVTFSTFRTSNTTIV